MKTKSTLSGLKNLIDNISFEKNQDVNRAIDAVKVTDQEFWPPWGLLSGWTSGFDKGNGYVVFFLPLYDFKNLTDEDLNTFYEIIRKKFVEANFEILHEEDLSGNVYFHVGFALHSYILKNLV